MFRAVAVVSAFALAAALALPARAQNIVLNPGFDDSPLGVDWTFTAAASGSDFFYGPGPGFGAVSPPNSANFGAVAGDDDTISQILPTIAGHEYAISFDLAHDSTNSANDFHASFGSDSLLNLVNTASFSYTVESFTAEATGSSTAITFAGRENPAWYDLDNVSVVDLGPASVPEPGPVALLIGAAVSGSLLLRRRTASRKA